MNNAHQNYPGWRLLLLIGIALTAISCGTSTVGNPGNSSVISFKINGQDTSGAIITYWYDSVSNHWDFSIDPATSRYVPEKALNATFVNRGDTSDITTDGSIKTQ
jgi:hypothetical protein